METTLPSPGTGSWCRRLMPLAIASGLLFILAIAQTARAQTSSQLSLSNNYFVTGNYVVGGVGLRGLGNTTTNLATGTISIPDMAQPNASSVPAGADIVAAFLYWETIEKTKSTLAGQQGFFNGYAITGTILGNPNAPTSWSSGGCAGSSNGTTTIRVYRADVRPFLNLDTNGNPQGNGSYQVSLADSGSNGGGAPLTMGASLVIIYRVESPTVPLNSIVLYDGVIAPSNASSTVSQPIIGFYQAAASPVAKITHIVGNGQPNKSESVFVNSVNLPSLYGALPPFPGIYNGSWDNPTWSINTAVQASDASETTSVVPAAQGSGCVNWGAIVLSTTVQDSDGDGLLDAWEDNQGYIDAISGQWVALPGANKSVKDIFVEIDYLSNLDLSASSYKHSHLPKQAALDMVGTAFKNRGVNVHFDLGPGLYQGDPYVISYPVSAPVGVATYPGAGGNAISEAIFLCKDSTTLCEFLGDAAIGWKGGYLFAKNTAPNPTANPPVPLMGNFQPGRKDSYHYVLFGHALGSPRTYWTAAGKARNLVGSGVATLVSIVVSNGVGTVTLTTPQSLLKPGDVGCSDANCDRVTVEGALQPQNAPLNATYKFLGSPSSTFDSISNMFTTTFTIQTSNVTNGAYDFFSEPQLGLTYGGPTSASGYSDLGGADTAVMFGLWPSDDVLGCQADPSVALATGQTYCTNQVGTTTAEAGTLLHEMGHTFFLTHGGTYFPNGAVVSGPLAGQQGNNPLAVPSYGLNCNAGYVSSMNYLFQVRGFPDGGIDYSGQTLPNLSEAALDERLGIGLDVFTNLASAHFTRWYAPPNALDIRLQNSTRGRFATRHCDGTPITDGAQMVRVDGSTFSAPIDWNNNFILPDLIEPVAWQDVDFNGSTASSSDPAFAGFNDWVNFDLRQVSARASAFGFSGSGGHLTGVGGGHLTGVGGGHLTGVGGGHLTGVGGGTEQDSEMACSTADPATGLSAVQSGHTVALNWTGPELCQVRRYDIWRAVGSFPTLASVLANSNAFSSIKTLTGVPPSTTFTDTNVKNKTTYTYFVTATNKQGATSIASAPATVSVVF